MTHQEEKKNKTIAMVTSLGIHGALLLAFIFMVAWRPPNPPLPTIGLEVNFGMDDQGTGLVQPKEPVGSQGTQTVEPDQPETQEEVEQTPQPTEVVPDEPEVVSKIESPVVVPEKKKEEPKPEKPVVKEQPKKEETEKPKVNQDAVFKPNTPQNESSNKSTDGKAGTAGSHGDDVNKAGDKGNPEGSLDAKSLYGNPGGGGGGPKLDLAGWNWDRMPKPEIGKSESGRIVFEIKVDENGDIVNIKTLERSASIDAERACRAELQRLTFSKQGGANVPPISTGTITFVIVAK